MPQSKVPEFYATSVFGASWKWVPMSDVLSARASAAEPGDLSAAAPTADASSQPANPDAADPSALPANPAMSNTDPEPLPAKPSAPLAPLPNAPDPVPQASGWVPEGSGWRGAVSIYGWFAGVHGTAGVLGHDTGIHIPFSDLFHYLKGIVPIAVEADKGRFVMPIDYLWIKLGDDKALPLTDIGQTSINAHFTESILTPKVGYRIVDGEHLKLDALAGIRYWYLSQNLTLEPAPLPTPIESRII